MTLGEAVAWAFVFCAGFIVGVSWVRWQMADEIRVVKAMICELRDARRQLEAAMVAATDAAGEQKE